jgi:penicillin-binding protein 1C
VGYTRSWLVAVWVGNFDGRPMSEVSGVTGAAPLWAQVLDLVQTDAEPFSDPPGSERREVCTLSGGAPGPSCPRATDWFPAGRGPAPCAWHVAGCGVAWPAELAGWARDEGLPACALAGGGSEGLAVRWPDEGAVVWIDPRLPAEEQQLPLSAVGPSGASFRWRVDGQDVGDGQVGVRFPWTSTGPGEHVVEIVVDGAPVGRRTVVVRGGP